MATPITFRTVNTPNFGAALSTIDRAGQNLGDAFSGLGGRVQEFADAEQKRQTDDFIAELNALDTEEERNALVAQAKQGFLDIGRVNKAGIAATQEDRAAGRFESQQAAAADLLTTNALAREQTQQTIAQKNITDPLAVDKLILDADIAQQNFDLAGDRGENAQTLFDQSQADRQANEVLTTLTRANAVATQGSEADARIAKSAINKSVKAIRGMTPGAPRGKLIDQIRESLEDFAGTTTPGLDAALSGFRDEDLSISNIRPADFDLTPLELKAELPPSLEQFAAYESSLAKAISFSEANRRATPGAVQIKVQEIINKDPLYARAKKKATLLQKSNDMTDNVNVATQSKMANNAAIIAIATTNKGEVSTIIDLLRTDHPAGYPKDVIKESTLLRSIGDTLDNVYSAYRQQWHNSDGTVNLAAKSAYAHATYKAYATMAANNTFFWGADSEVVGLGNSDGIFYDSDIGGFKGDELRAIMNSFLPDNLKVRTKQGLAKSLGF